MNSQLINMLDGVRSMTRDANHLIETAAHLEDQITASVLLSRAYANLHTGAEEVRRVRMKMKEEADRLARLEAEADSAGEPRDAAGYKFNDPKAAN